jgi:hypothetical protein
MPQITSSKQEHFFKRLLQYYVPISTKEDDPPPVNDLNLNNLKRHLKKDILGNASSE